MDSPAERIIRRVRDDMERCLSIMEPCTTRDDILGGLAQVAHLLHDSENPLAEEAERALQAGRTSPEPDLTRLRDGFVAECRGFLESTTLWTPSELDRLREWVRRQP
jgi:hypothetical protein